MKYTEDLSESERKGMNVVVKTNGNLSDEILLKGIKKKEIKTGVDNITIYELGLFTNSDGSTERIDLFVLHPDSNEGYYPPHIHKKVHNLLYILQGEGIIILDGVDKTYHLGMKFIVEKGMTHGFRPKKRTLILSFETPPIIDPVTNKVDLEYPLL